MSQQLRPDRRPYPGVSYPEVCRLLDLLTDQQRDAVEKACPDPWFSTRTTLAMYYQEAVRRGWLLGPA